VTRDSITYLDWAATSLPDTAILSESLERSCLAYGNPSSAHSPGKTARALLEEARTGLMTALETHKGQERLAFTGSGTEADQIALLSVLATSGLEGKRPIRYVQEGPAHIIVSAIEHPAVYAQAEALKSLGLGLTIVKPGPDGRIAPQKIGEAIQPQTRLVAVMAVNNETGAIQDIEGIAAAIQKASSTRPGQRILLHIDCVQALGKIPFALPSACSSSAAFSAHKLGGPKGVGALWTSTDIKPLGAGGGQEGGLRSGTENLFGALAFAACAIKAIENLEQRLVKARKLEAALIEGIRQIPGARILPENRMPGDQGFSPWIISASFPGLGGEVLARALSDEGIAVSTGSACSHLDRKRGHRILDAMGIHPDLSFSSLRVSTGYGTEPGEIEYFLSKAADLYRRLKT